MLSILLNAGRAIASRYAAWRRNEQAFAELSSLDDRSLADIGITRAEIPYVLAHARANRVSTPATGAVANANLRHAA
jgi:uncharacterized protein YjiS (DUF1127 family)